MTIGRHLLFSSLAAALTGVAGAGEPPPNIVLFLADDVGFEVFPTYGGESYRTPNLDALAETGIQFEHCYAQPMCSPSRVKIMTGKYNFRNYDGWGKLPDDQTTFAHVLRTRGYATAVAGKWQLWREAQPESATPQEAGFDEHFLWRYLDNGDQYWNPVLHENDVLVETTEDDYGPNLVRDFVIEFMTEHRDEPFFVYYPMLLTHVPFVQTPDSPPSSDTAEEFFVDMVHYMDKVVGQVLEALDDLGLSENTIVLFTADNGTHNSITSMWNGIPLTGNKSHPDDLGTHVPLYVNWEGRTPDGATSDDLIDFTSFLATLADAAGAEIPDDADGQSFLPQILGDSGKPWPEFVYTWYNMRRDPGEAPYVRFARDQRWKLYDDNRLFDVPADIHEQRPIYLDGTGEQAVARTQLQAAMDTVESELLPGDIDADGIVDVTDLLVILAAWGPCDNPCPGNLDRDGRVGVSDLLVVLSGWS